MGNRIPSATQVLLIDDDFGVPGSTFEAKYRSLEHRDRPYRFHYETAADGNGYSVEAALRKVNSIGPLDVVLLDIKFGREDDRLGLEILKELRAERPLLPIIMLTSLDGDLDALERAMELGANEYLIKSPSAEELERALRIYTRPEADEQVQAIWGNAPSIAKLRAQIARVAAGGSAPVLLLGETGTGKELIAKAIHRFGPRRQHPFIAKNCAYSDSQLLDAELFGQEKGSYTGAETRPGLIEQVKGGILFLDEIGSMPLALQGKLLRLLEEKTYRPVGASEERTADFQLITATNRDLDQLVEKQEMHRDLYYRIRVIQIYAPPLRERREDIPLLAQLFLRRFRQKLGHVYPAERFTDEALNLLRTTGHPWNGNARELRNLVELCGTMGKSEAIDVEDLRDHLPHSSTVPGSPGVGAGHLSHPEGLQISEEGMNLPLWLARMELSAIRQALTLCKGNKTKVMKLLYPGAPNHYFYRMIYNAVRRAEEVLIEFPDLQADYQREADRRKQKDSDADSH